MRLCVSQHRETNHQPPFAKSWFICHQIRRTCGFFVRMLEISLLVTQDGDSPSDKIVTRSSIAFLEYCLALKDLETCLGGNLEERLLLDVLLVLGRLTLMQDSPLVNEPASIFSLRTHSIIIFYSFLISNASKYSKYLEKWKKGHLPLVTHEQTF